MTGNIIISGKEIGFTANAATPYRFKNVFGVDFFSLATGDLTDAEAVNTYTKLAFIMAKQYEGADMAKLTEEQFYAWLEQFESEDVINAMPEVAAIYAGNTKQSVDPK